LEWVKATTEQKRELVKKLDVGSLTPNPNLVYETTVSEFDTDFGKVGLVPSMDFLNKLLINKRMVWLSLECCGRRISNSSSFKFLISVH
jgi:hypothetical protein